MSLPGCSSCVYKNVAAGEKVQGGCGKVKAASRKASVGDQVGWQVRLGCSKVFLQSRESEA